MRLSVLNIILIVTLVFGAAVGSAYLIYWAFTKDTISAALADGTMVEKPPVSGPMGPTIGLGTFTVNLAGGNRYLRSEIVLEMTERNSVQEIENRKPQVLDTINAVIRTFSSEELFAPGGDLRLKEGIVEALNPLLTRGRVTGVYFTSWVVQ